jgi:hypothetical protein
MAYDIWGYVAAAKGWLDRTQKNPGSDDNLTIRVGSVADCTGAAFGALVDARENGGSWAGVNDGLCAAALAALLALATSAKSVPAAKAYLGEYAAAHQAELAALLEAGRATAAGNGMEPLFDLPHVA